MQRRTFVELIAASALFGCVSPPRELPTSPDFAVRSIAERTIDALPQSPMFWRIEIFPTLREAQDAAGPMSLSAEASGRAWLVTLGERGALTPGATHVAVIGPVPRIQAVRYKLRLNHAHAPPGAATSVHTHPGSEAFYVLSGQLSQRTMHGVSRVDASQTMNGHMPGMAMQLQSTGSESLDQLVLFVVDADQPFSSPARFRR